MSTGGDVSRASDRLVIPARTYVWAGNHGVGPFDKLFVCSECGCLLHAAGQRVHDDWHDHLLGFAQDFIEHTHDPAHIEGETR